MTVSLDGPVRRWDETPATSSSDDRFPPSPVRQALRSATTGLHGRLHRAPLFRNLLSANLSLSGYGDLLARLYAVYVPLDARLTGAESRLADLRRLNPYQPRSPLLRCDLADLAVDRPLPGNRAELQYLPRVDTIGEALGVLYVVEGASLGSRLLATKLDGVLGDSSRGRSYFTWCAAQDRFRWHEICVAIESTGRRYRQRQEMIDAARQTFSLFLRGLNATSQGSPDVRASVALDSGHA